MPPVDPFLAWNAERHFVTDSTRWALAGHIDADPMVHLVDLESGDTIDVLGALPRALGDIGEIELVALLPGDEHIYLDSWNGPFVIPVADPGSAYRVGKLDEVENAAVSPSGEQIVFTRNSNTETGTEEAVLTGIDLAAPEVIASIPSTKSANELFARNLPDGVILFESPTRAWLYDPGMAAEQTLPLDEPGICGPIDAWMPSPSGNTIVYSLETGGCGGEESRPNAWWFFDRRSGEGRHLAELDGYRMVERIPLASTAHPGFLPSSFQWWGEPFDWVLFAPEGEASRVSDYTAIRRLELETGALAEIAGMPAGEGHVLAVPAPPDGEVFFALLHENLDGESYLIDVNGGHANLLSSNQIGAFSPDGAWLALTAYAPGDEGFQTDLSMRRMADGATFDLGEGIATWLAP